MSLSGVELSTADVKSMFAEYRKNIINKIKNGETEESIPIGGSSFTGSEWERVLNQVDEKINQVIEEQKEKEEAAKTGKVTERSEAQSVFEAVSAGTKALDGLHKAKSNVPYGYLAKNGTVEYNGVTFVCDEEHKALCLGDMSQKEKVITIPMSNGGSLKVNIDELGSLSHAIGMFSPEDVNRILRAVAQVNKTNSMEQELKETEDSIVKEDDEEQESV